MKIWLDRNTSFGKLVSDEEKQDAENKFVFTAKIAISKEELAGLILEADDDDGCLEVQA